MQMARRYGTGLLLILILSWTDRSLTDRGGREAAPVFSSGPSGPTATLRPLKFQKLPVTAFNPSGWLKRQMELQRDGLTGHLSEISIWLMKKDNAWLRKDGKGKYGWEELPYWLKGYGNIAYMLKDSAMIRESKTWIEAVLKNQRPDGDFGPLVLKKGNRDLWT